MIRGFKETTEEAPIRELRLAEFTAALCNPNQGFVLVIRDRDPKTEEWLPGTRIYTDLTEDCAVSLLRQTVEGPQDPSSMSAVLYRTPAGG